MCFVPVECVTVVRFNRYQIVFLYDPLGTFEEIALVGGEGVYSDSCYQIVVITYSFLLFFFEILLEYLCL